MNSLIPQKQTATIAPHSSGEAAGLRDDDHGINGMFTEEEAMAKIAANIRRKRERTPLEKTALKADYTAIKVNPVRHKPIRLRYIAKGQGKAPREISVLTRGDIKTGTALSKGVAKSAELFATESDFGAIRGRGRKQAVEHLIRCLNGMKQGGTILQADIQEFYPSTPHTIFQKQHFGTRQWTFIKAEMEEYGRAKMRKGVGLPQGAPLSPPLALYALTRILHDLRSQPGFSKVVTYVDDLAIIDEDEDSAVKTFKAICDGLREQGLLLHPGKIDITSWVDGNTLNYLGYDFTRRGDKTIVSLPEEKLRKLERNIPQAGAGRTKVRMYLDGWASEYQPVTDETQLEYLHRVRGQAFQQAPSVALVTANGAPGPILRALPSPITGQD